MKTILLPFLLTLALIAPAAANTFQSNNLASQVNDTDIWPVVQAPSTSPADAKYTALMFKNYVLNAFSWSEIVSGKPTTLAGYGITDAESASAAAAAFQPLNANLTLWSALAPTNYETASAASARFAPISGSANYDAAGVAVAQVANQSSPTITTPTFNSTGSTARITQQLIQSGTGTASGPSFLYPVTAWIPPESLPHWKAALARVETGSGSATVVCYGDSTTSGNGCKAFSPPSFLATALNSQAIPAEEESTFGNNRSGLAFYNPSGLSVPSYDPRVNYDASWVDSGDDLGANASTAGATMTFRPQSPVDSVDIYYVQAPSGYGTFSVSIDGGSALATINTNGGSLINKKVTVTFPLGVHTIKLVTASSLTVLLNGLVSYNSQLPSVHVVNWGVGSGYAEEFTSTGYGSPNFVLTSMQPDLVILGGLVNDLRSTGNNDTAAQLLTLVTNEITAVQASSPNTDIILEIMNPLSDSNYVAQLPAYRAGIYALAQSKGLPVIDLSNQFGSYAQAVAGGLMNGDPLHPTPLGNRNIADYIASQLVQTAGAGLSSPSTINGSLSVTALPTPAAPTLYDLVTGTTTQSYEIVAKLANGTTTAAGPPGTSTTSAGGQVSLSWPEVVGTISYDVYRTAGATTGKIGNTRIPYFLDSGFTGDLSSPPTVNTTGTSAVASPQTTVSGSTSGSVVFFEPETGASQKRVTFYASALTGTATYTFPFAFTNTPSANQISLPSGVTCTAISTTAMTLTGTGTSGGGSVDGF